MCNKCKGAGKIGHLYCTCAEGRFKKMMDASKTKAEAKKQEERKLKMSPEALKKEQKKKKNMPFIDVGDWVYIKNAKMPWIDGTLCFVLEIEGDEVYVAAFRSKEGARMSGERWFDIKHIKKAPPAQDEQDLKTMIDMAIDTNDEVWFLELITKLR